MLKLSYTISVKFCAVRKSDIATKSKNMSKMQRKLWIKNKTYWNCGEET